MLHFTAPRFRVQPLEFKWQNISLIIQWKGEVISPGLGGLGLYPLSETSIEGGDQGCVVLWGWDILCRHTIAKSSNINSAYIYMVSIVHVLHTHTQLHTSSYYTHAALRVCTLVLFHYMPVTPACSSSKCALSVSIVHTCIYTFSVVVVINTRSMKYCLVLEFNNSTCLSFWHSALLLCNSDKNLPHKNLWWNKQWIF